MRVDSIDAPDVVKSSSSQSRNAIPIVKAPSKNTIPIIKAPSNAPENRPRSTEFDLYSRTAQRELDALDKASKSKQPQSKIRVKIKAPSNLKQQDESMSIEFDSHSDKGQWKRVKYDAAEDIEKTDSLRSTDSSERNDELKHKKRVVRDSMDNTSRSSKLPESQKLKTGSKYMNKGIINELESKSTQQISAEKDKNESGLSIIGPRDPNQKTADKHTNIPTTQVAKLFANDTHITHLTYPDLIRKTYPYFTPTKETSNFTSNYFLDKNIAFSANDPVNLLIPASHFKPFMELFNKEGSPWTDILRQVYNNFVVLPKHGYFVSVWLRGKNLPAVGYGNDLFVPDILRSKFVDDFEKKFVMKGRDVGKEVAANVRITSSTFIDILRSRIDDPLIIGPNVVENEGSIAKTISAKDMPFANYASSSSDHQAFISSPVADSSKNNNASFLVERSEENEAEKMRCIFANAGENVPIRDEKNLATRDTVKPSYSIKRNFNYEELVCDNCLTSDTSQWRHNKPGTNLCNECGIFFKRYGTSRPVRKNDRINRSQTKDESSFRQIPIIQKKTNGEHHQSNGNTSTPISNQAFARKIITPTPHKSITPLSTFTPQEKLPLALPQPARSSILKVADVISKTSTLPTKSDSFKQIHLLSPIMTGPRAASPNTVTYQAASFNGLTMPDNGSAIVEAIQSTALAAISALPIQTLPITQKYLTSNSIPSTHVDQPVSTFSIPSEVLIQDPPQHNVNTKPSVIVSSNQAVNYVGYSTYIKT